MAVTGPAAVASIGLVLLSVALVLRLAVYRADVAADLRAPERVFGFFTIVAGFDVLGVRLDAAGHPLATAILAALAALVWLLLTYGVPASLLLAREPSSVLAASTATWLLWVVEHAVAVGHRSRPGPGPGRRKLRCWPRPPSGCGASGWCCTCCWFR